MPNYMCMNICSAQLHNLVKLDDHMYTADKVNKLGDKCAEINFMAMFLGSGTMPLVGK